MDRNQLAPHGLPNHGVALRKESVDRNCRGGCGTLVAGRSLSARRAWIEIAWPVTVGRRTTVALRKESVDRNQHALAVTVASRRSLSARRAWIEITLGRTRP